MTENQQSRIAFLRERVDAAQGAEARQTSDVPFRQHQLALVKIDVPIDFPLYNVLSGRTHRSQSAWIESRGLDQDFFADPEDESVQRAQHEILLQLIHEEGLDVDLEMRQQQRPVVLTYDGFIVDGNRRVTALRDGGQTENVVAVVLPPDSTPSDLYETELELQMARETRADYNWIDAALHVRYGIQTLHEPLASVARRMNIPEDDVQDILARLILVDRYLVWAGYPEQYHRVPELSEQAFIELASRINSQGIRSLTQLHRETIQLACYSVIQSSVGGYQDVRNLANTLRTKPAEVVTRVRERLPDDLIAALDRPLPASDEPAQTLFGELMEATEDEAAPQGIELLNLLRDPEIAPVCAVPLIEIAKDILEEERETQSQLEALRKVERALQNLRAVRISLGTARRQAVRARLTDVQVEVDRLSNELGEDSAV